jgi:hypothetical protein
VPQFDNNLLTFEWLMLLLRIAFIGLIYLFLYQIAQVALRELVHIGRAVGQQERSAPEHAATAVFSVIDPAKSSFAVGERVAIGTYVTIGRASANTLVFEDDFTSSRHAEIALDGNRWIVRDLSSTNGTYLNGHRVKGQAHIRDGDELGFGNVVVEFTL